MHSVTLQTLEDWNREGRPYLLIDVRETFEHEADNIGGKNIPMNALSGAAERLPKDADIVLYCAKGIRSVIAIQRLQSKGFSRLYNLSGGMAAIRGSY